MELDFINVREHHTYLHFLWYSYLMRCYKATTKEDYQYIASLFRPENNTFLLKKEMTGEEVEAQHRQHEHVHTFILENDTERIGWVTCTYKPETKRASLGMVIDTPFQGKGYGTEAMNCIEKEAHTLGATKLELDVFIDNVRAVALYKKTGFSPVRTMMRMEKDII